MEMYKYDHKDRAALTGECKCIQHYLQMFSETHDKMNSTSKLNNIEHDDECSVELYKVKIGKIWLEEKLAVLWGFGKLKFGVEVVRSVAFARYLFADFGMMEMR